MLDLELSKILENGQYTPAEIQAQLAQAGYRVDLAKLADHLNVMVALGATIKYQDGTFSSKPY